MSKTLLAAVCLGLSALAAAQAPSAAATPPKPWSPYQAVKSTEPPPVKQKAWVRTPIDAYVLAQLEAKGLKPSPDADRATYIRRATLDTWGLLPTPQEVK